MIKTNLRNVNLVAFKPKKMVLTQFSSLKIVPVEQLKTQVKKYT